MYIEGTKRSSGKILLPVDSIVTIQQMDSYNKGYYLAITVKGLKLFPIEYRGQVDFYEIETIELEDDFNAFTFKFKIAKGLTNETPKKHKETE